MIRMFWGVLVLAQITCARSSFQTNPTAMNWEELIRAGQPILVENKVFEKSVDFTQLLTPQALEKGRKEVVVEGNIVFRNCTFKKAVIAFRQNDEQIISATFRGALIFNDCRFEQNVQFRASTVYGPVNFSNSTFAQLANFESTNFFQQTAFKQCVFEGEVRFQNSFFMQQANFLDSQFDDNVSFQQCTANGELQLANTTFQQYADFSLLDCRGTAFFNYAIFLDRADFSNARFQRTVHFISTNHRLTHFDEAQFMDTARFFKSTVKEALHFKAAFFLRGMPTLDFIAEEKLIVN